MTISGRPWLHPDPRHSQLRLTQIPPDVLLGLERGIVHDFETPMSSYLMGAECASLWLLRSQQVAAAPRDAPWVNRFVVVPDVPYPVGLAGFHGPPDVRGMVEVGYRIDPQHRRRGYARQALQTLLSVAHDHPDICVVRAAISTGNTASRALVASSGFVEVGEQWDSQDGLETIFERPSRAPESSRD